MGLFKRNDSTEIVQKEMQISYIYPTRTPQVGLNRITREQNVLTIRILLCSFCELKGRKHISQRMKFIRSTFSLINIINILRFHEAHFFFSDRTQNFSRFQNLEVSCDWLVSADARGEGTRDLTQLKRVCRVGGFFQWGYYPCFSTLRMTYSQAKQNVQKIPSEYPPTEVPALNQEFTQSTRFGDCGSFQLHLQTITNSV